MIWSTYCYSLQDCFKLYLRSYCHNPVAYNDTTFASLTSFKMDYLELTLSEMPVLTSTFIDNTSSNIIIMDSGVQHDTISTNPLHFISTPDLPPTYIQSTPEREIQLCPQILMMTCGYACGRKSSKRRCTNVRMP